MAVVRVILAAVVLAPVPKARMMGVAAAAITVVDAMAEMVASPVPHVTSAVTRAMGISGVAVMPSPIAHSAMERRPQFKQERLRKIRAGKIVGKPKSL